MVKENVLDASGKPMKCNREKGYLYFVSNTGEILRAKMSRGKMLSDAEIKRREQAAKDKTAKYKARVAANAKKREELKAEKAQKRTDRIAARKAKLKAKLAALGA